MSTPTPRPGILDIDPYVAGDSHAPGAPRIIKLSSNECSLGPSPKAVAAFREAGDHLYRYPDSAAAALRKAIAAEYNLDAEAVYGAMGGGDARPYKATVQAFGTEMIALADPFIDFTDNQFVFFLLPKSIVHIEHFAD